MSNNKELVANPGNAMELLKGLWAGQKKEQQTMIFQANPAIKVQHNTSKPKFEIPGKDTAHPIKVGIVDVVKMQELRFPGDDSPAPECQSVGGINGTKYGTCKNCKFNKWVTDANGKNSKACKEYNKLAVVLLDDEEPKVYELKVSAASTKSMKEYIQMLSTQEDKALGEVITKLSLSPVKAGSKQYSVINFEKDSDIDKAPADFLDRLVLGYKTVKNNFFRLTEPQEVTPEAKKTAELMAAPTTDDETAEEVEDAEVVKPGKVVAISSQETIPF